MAEFVAMLEEEFMKHRKELICLDGSIRSPLVVLREVSRIYGTPLHMEFHQVLISSTKRAYQVEMYVGLDKGRGDAPGRNLAMQIAAADVLTKMKTGAFEIPHYGLIPGTLVPPTVFVDLLALCEHMSIAKPFYVIIPNDPEVVPEYTYTYKCQIGQLICFGKSDCKYMARRLAAKNTFEALIEGNMDLDEVHYGAGSNLLEKYKIIPHRSQMKVDIMRYQQESRRQDKKKAADTAQTLPPDPLTSPRSSASTGQDSSFASTVKEEEDEVDFEDDDEDEELEHVSERVQNLSIDDMRARIDQMRLKYGMKATGARAT